MMTRKGLTTYALGGEKMIECVIGTLSEDVVYFQSVTVNTVEDDGDRWFLKNWRFVGLSEGSK
jgi:hypothetical protein